MRSGIVRAVAPVVGVLAFASPAFADTKVVDDDKVQCPSAQFTSIQAAVDAAASGDEISVCAGRYGPVRIPAGKFLFLKGARGFGSGRCRDAPGWGEDPRVDSIVSGSLGRPAFEVAASFVDIYNFTIRNAVGAAGVEVGAAGGVGINSNIVKANTIGVRVAGLRGTLSVFDNCFAANNAPGEGSGNALVAAVATSDAYAHITRNAFTRQTTGSVSITGSGVPSVNVDFTLNRLIKDASIRMLDVYSVEIRNTRITDSRGSAVVISGGDFALLGENTISGCGSTGMELYGVAVRASLFENGISGCAQYGILVRNVPASLRLHKSTIAGNGLDGIRLVNVVGGTVKRNKLTGNGRDGLSVDADSHDILLQLNRALDNAEYDCHDASAGSGTGGTANTWIDNVGRTDSPEEICTPP